MGVRARAVFVNARVQFGSIFFVCVDGGAASLDDPPEVPPVACFECDLNQSRNSGRIDPDPKVGLVAHHPFDARNESARVHATGHYKITQRWAFREFSAGLVGRLRPSFALRHGLAP